MSVIASEMPSFEQETIPAEITETVAPDTSTMESFELPTFTTEESVESESVPVESMVSEKEESSEVHTIEDTPETQNKEENTTTNESETISEKVENITTNINQENTIAEEDTTIEENNTTQEEETTQEDEEPIAAYNPQSPSEETETNTSADNSLVESFWEFQSLLQQLLAIQSATTTRITGHRTDTEQVEYEMSQDDDHSTIIKHHTTTGWSEDQTILSFEWQDPLSIYLNNELLASYGESTEEDQDITYYLKDKLSKLTTLISEEITKEEKKLRENKEKRKQYIEILRSF